MSYGPNTVYKVTFASAGTFSSELDLKRTWKKLYVDATGALAEMRMVATDAAGGTYRQVYHPSINSATVAANIFKIPSSTSGGYIEIPAGFRFIKLEVTAAIANGATFKIIASD